MSCNEENTPLLSGDIESQNVSPVLNIYPEDEEYTRQVMNAIEAIEQGVLPERIYQGSSGSYFVKDVDGNKIGVFKPKDEEPYGHLNPKWTKWMHKHCCPCCFGRSCLVPNQGYISEAGASLIDTRLKLNIVPKTKVVRLVSESFNYNAVDRAKSRTKQHVASHFPELGRHFHRLGLPPKVGSFQLFVSDCQEAEYWMRRFGSQALPKPTALELQFQFEKLVVLDYLIRNTDRGNDNWLVRYRTSEVVENGEQSDSNEEWGMVDMPKVEVYAIDNGLAFPFKHPDEWRAYPFHWVWLDMAKLPFSDSIKEHVLPLLSDVTFVNHLVQDLHDLFRLDPGFDESTFRRQISVLRGQIINLVAALRDSKSPYDLVHMPVLTLERNASKRCKRPQWPHQRLAAGLAQHQWRTPNNNNMTETVAMVHSEPTTANDILAFSSHYQNHQINTNDEHISYPSRRLSSSAPSFPISLHKTDCFPTAVSLDAVHDVSCANPQDQTLEQGLVALPFSHHPRSYPGRIEARDNQDGLQTGDGFDENDEEERFKLQYSKRPFFTWF